MEPNWTTARDLFERDLTVYDTPSGEDLPVSLEANDSGHEILDQDKGAQTDLPSTLEFSDAEGDSIEAWKDRPRRLRRQDATVTGSADLSGEGIFLHMSSFNFFTSC